ncbi:hypothetical protein Q9Q99_15965 [Curtobacterium flaccumfaciens]|nr:hypothetical protein Q9Q99_15965 [Curtobacterium flaccumfaciens]
MARESGPRLAGPQTFRIHNTSVAGIEVQLVDPTNGAVYLDAEGLGAGATHDYGVRLPRGQYRFRCLPADANPGTGPVVHLRGATHVSDETPRDRPGHPRRPDPRREVVRRLDREPPADAARRRACTGRRRPDG